MTSTQPVQFFLNADALIKTGADGYPQLHAGAGLELTILDAAALKAIRFLNRREELTPHEASVMRLARTDIALLASMRKRDRDPALAAARFRARAELVEPDDD